MAAVIASMVKDPLRRGDQVKCTIKSPTWTSNVLGKDALLEPGIQGIVMKREGDAYEILFSKYSDAILVHKTLIEKVEDKPDKKPGFSGKAFGDSLKKMVADDIVKDVYEFRKCNGLTQSKGSVRTLKLECKGMECREKYEYGGQLAEARRVAFEVWGKRNYRGMEYCKEDCGLALGVTAAYMYDTRGYSAVCMPLALYRICPHGHREQEPLVDYVDPRQFKTDI